MFRNFASLAHKIVCGVSICFLLSTCTGFEEYDDVHYTNSWAVHIEQGGSQVANRIAKRHGFVNLGQVN